MLANEALGHLLKDICLAGWSNEPARALAASAALNSLADVNPQPEIYALRDWASGLEHLIRGQMEASIDLLDRSQKSFLELSNSKLAAATQVSKLIALAMLGRYDEAIQCGLSARKVFEEVHDTLATGKIEHNIGNIYFRRDQYREAEKFQRSARQHFLAANDLVQIAKIENSLALTLAQQHQVHAAESLYQQALQKAEKAGLVTTQAEIESSIGTLALYQGYYDRALDYLERSRRKYADLDRPHILAMTEQEIADAYLELNLATEAVGIYERVVERFSQLGMRAEEARALAYRGRAEIALGNFDRAQSLLGNARVLFMGEGNTVGAALVELTESQLHYARNEYGQARAAANHAAAALETAANPRRLIFARWLEGEAARADEAVGDAQEILTAVLASARSSEQSDIAARCLTSLGLLAAKAGHNSLAEQHFREAVDLIEQLRAPLPAEEFRSAFFSDKLVPYHELVRLCLIEGPHRFIEALNYLERARSRALVDALTGFVKAPSQARDEYEARLLKQLEEQRHQLSYFYSQINQPVGPNHASNQQQVALQAEAREREMKIAELTRQLQHRGGLAHGRAQELNLPGLRLSLDTGRALIEFANVDDELLAFVVTDERVEVFRQLCSEREIARDVVNFRFQIDSLRFGSSAIRKHLSSLTERTRKHLQGIYDKLLRPLRKSIADRDLVIVPQGSLHYLPFHALHDGSNYLIEGQAVSYSPSAVVLQHCLEHRRTVIRRALLMGIADERTPRIADEIRALSPLFSESVTLLGAEATLESLLREAPRSDVLHLACHAQFRKQSPHFSSLQLGDGWLTVTDAYKLKLDCELVTLSACETGMNVVVPGDELIGLARGFLSAGAPSVLLSLWTVDDEATALLMSEFYAELNRSGSMSQSLRLAQTRMLQEKSHPFFWSPFVLVGRW